MQETVHASEGIHPGFETQVDVNGLTRRSNVLQKKCKTPAGSQIEFFTHGNQHYLENTIKNHKKGSPPEMQEYFAVTVNVFIKDTGHLETFSA